MRILIVASDPATMDLICSSMAEAGFAVLAAREPVAVMRHYDAETFLAVVLDLDGDGPAICRQIRELNSDIPILAISEFAANGDVDDGLDYGVDDFLTKPFEGRVFVARVRAMLRRVARRNASEHLLRVRDLVIDEQRLQVSMAGREISLTPTEFRLLYCLARNTGRVITSRELLEQAHGYECQEQEAQEIVKVHVNHLRQKIDRHHSTPSYIVNVRGFGYMLDRRQQSLLQPALRSQD